MSEEDHSNRAALDASDQHEDAAGDRPVRVIEFRKAPSEPDRSDRNDPDVLITAGVLMVTLCGLCSAGVLWNSRSIGREGGTFVLLFGGGPILIGVILILLGIAARQS